MIPSTKFFLSYFLLKPCSTYLLEKYIFREKLSKMINSATFCRVPQQPKTIQTSTDEKILSPVLHHSASQMLPQHYFHGPRSKCRTHFRNALPARSVGRALNVLRVFPLFHLSVLFFAPFTPHWKTNYLIINILFNT